MERVGGLIVGVYWGGSPYGIPRPNRKLGVGVASSNHIHCLGSPRRSLVCSLGWSLSLSQSFNLRVRCSWRVLVLFFNRLGPSLFFFFTTRFLRSTIVGSESVPMMSAKSPDLYWPEVINFYLRGD